MNPKLRSLLARVMLVGGIASVAAILARDAPHEQTLTIRLGELQVSRVDGVVTRIGDEDSDPIAGFSRDFREGSPRFVHHTFSAPNGTYSVVITLRPARGSEIPGGVAGTETPAGDGGPIPSETSFERRVSLGGGEVIVSPD